METGGLTGSSRCPAPAHVLRKWHPPYEIGLTQRHIVRKQASPTAQRSRGADTEALVITVTTDRAQIDRWQRLRGFTQCR